MEPFYKKPENPSKSFSVSGFRNVFVNQTDEDVFIVIAEVERILGFMGMPDMIATGESPYTILFEPLKSEEEVVDFLETLLKDSY